LKTDENLAFNCDISTKKVFYVGNYACIYLPEHPRATMGNGTVVYLHRIIMEQHLGRYLTKDENIHHIDEDPHNNNIDNLCIVSNSEHAKIHYSSSGINNSNTHSIRQEIECPTCHKMFTPRHKRLKYCSVECYRVSSRKFNPAKEELEELVCKMPLEKIGEMFGISGNAVKKRCNILKVKRPKQGYWA
jgi:hypothetical protein